MSRRRVLPLLIGSLAVLLAATPPPVAEPVTALAPWVAYQSGEAGAMEVRLVRADGSEDHRLLPTTMDAEHPDWSPQGAGLVFTSDSDGTTRDIWLAAADGSRAQRIFDCTDPCVDADGPAWSPDGGSIALRTLDQVDGTFVGSDLMVLDLATGSVRTVATTSAPAFIGNGTSVRWSGDGSSLVMDVSTIADPGTATEVTTHRDVAVLHLDDAEPALLPITDLGTLPCHPDWHPTQDVIVFMTGGCDGDRSALFTIATDGTGLAAVGGSAAGGTVWGPTWAPDGDTVWVTVLDDPWVIGTLTPDGSSLTRVPGPIVGAHPRGRPGAP